MHLGEDLIVLGILLLVAYVLGRLGRLVSLPAIPIYMIVGLLASPHTGWFPLNFDSHYIELIAIFGLILLLFNLGLEFDQDEFFGNFGKLIISGGSYVVERDRNQTAHRTESPGQPRDTHDPGCDRGRGHLHRRLSRHRLRGAERR